MTTIKSGVRILPEGLRVAAAILDFNLAGVVPKWTVFWGRRR
jgi:hypothetical protein